MKYQMSNTERFEYTHIHLIRYCQPDCPAEEPHFNLEQQTLKINI